MRQGRAFDPREVAALEKLLRETDDKGQLQRIQCVLLRVRQSLTSEQIAAVVGWHPGWVRQIWSAFAREGAAALVSQPRGGRHRSNLTLARERELVARFEAKAREGGLLVVSQLHAAYETAVGHPVPRSTIYRMLERQGWRKVAPRPRHPKNDPEQCEAFKKNCRR